MVLQEKKARLEEDKGVPNAEELCNDGPLRHSLIPSLAFGRIYTGGEHRGTPLALS